MNDNTVMKLNITFIKIVCIAVLCIIVITI